MKNLIFLPLLFIYSCTFNSGGINDSPSCGNNNLDIGEECDGNDYGGTTCEDHGYTGGSVICTSECTLDFSQCTSDGVCGDGVLDTGERCDGTQLGTETCENNGFGEGEISCNSDCTLNTSNCPPLETCGNGTLDNGEECDGDLLNSNSCLSLGYYGGTLGCTSDCHFDLNSCKAGGYCGDDIIQEDEVCDGTATILNSCENLGYYGGDLLCNSDCELDLSLCQATGTCGDNVIQTGFGETCDGTDLDGQSCATFGYYPGELYCDSACNFDLTSCIASGKCGDNIKQEIHGETCDGTDFGTTSCVTEGFSGGDIVCTSSCTTDTSQCYFCGDGEINPGETCDGTNISSTECIDLGFQEDPLVSCSSSCDLDTSNCLKLWSDFDTGYNHTCGIHDDGSLYCWGYNSVGQLGLGNNTNVSVPTRVGTDNDWRYVSLGMYTTCAIKTDNSLWCWGLNSFGQLGVGSPTYSFSSPTRVGTATDWNKVYPGFRSTCATKTNGTLYCWGKNMKGQLGIGYKDDIAHPSPIQVGSDTDWDVISKPAEDHVCGTKSNNWLYCWGDNLNGQLGIGLIQYQYSPTRVGNNSTLYTDIITMRFHTCGVRTSSALFCWGANDYGQLGTGDTTGTYYPTQVGSATIWQSFGGGYEYTCALKNNGRIACWGRNQDGQLGVGDLVQRESPENVGTDTDWIKLSSGYYHSCGLKSNGRLYCWGNNNYGQLGSGNLVSSTTPIRVNY